jgi:hypothetical protein
MRVAEIEVLHRDDFSQLQARVESDRAADDGDRFDSFILWYRFPPRCRPYLSPDNGDPFLAALLLPAMLMGERLSIAAGVSPRLLRRLPDLQAVYMRFDQRLKPVEVETATQSVSPPEEPAAATGLFLSLGVDSFYSLLKNLRDHPADEETIDHLITIHGFDVSHGVWDERFSPRMLANCERVARETGKTLLPVVTNLRPATREISWWSMSHGGALASVALALGGFLDRILIAASTTYDQLYPWGSHPVLDPLWSTERLTVVHDGCEMGRIDKVHFIAGSQLVLDTLRVCPYYNCGRCIKCLPTIIDLMQIGALERCATLPHEIDVARLRQMLQASRGQLNVENYARRLANLDAAGGPPGLREVLTEFLVNEGALGDTQPAPRRGKRSPFARLFARFAG